MARSPAVRRYRVLIWLDAATNVQTVAVATYVDDTRQQERTWAAEPFDSPHDALDHALHAIDEQLTLF